MSMVNIKIDVVIPYGDGIDKTIIADIPVIKRVINKSIFTVNRSPHGNKTAREQFKITGTKYSTYYMIDNVDNISALIGYYGDIGVYQGINNAYMQLSISYNVNYNRKD